MFAGGQLLYTPSFVFVRQGTVAFSKNGGMTWDDIPAAGLGGGIGKQVERLARHGTFLFALTGENKLYRLDLTTVTLTPTLKIAVEPKPAKSLVGGTLTMKVFAGGPGTLTYQWKKGAHQCTTLRHRRLHLRRHFWGQLRHQRRGARHRGGTP